MAETSHSPTLPTTVPTPVLNKAHFQQMGERIAELDGSQAELLSRIKELKEEVQKWRVNLDKQASAYKNELQDVKKELSSDVGQLQSEVKEMKTTIHARQNSWAYNLWNFAVNMKDPSEAGNDSIRHTEENSPLPYALDRKEFDA